MSDSVKEFREDAKNYRELAELHYQMATVYARLGFEDDAELSLRQHRKCLHAVKVWNEAAAMLEKNEAKLREGANA